MTTHCCEIHTTKRHNRSDKLSYALLGDRTETITDPTNCHMPCLVTERKQQTPQTKIEHAERSKKDALSAHIQDPTVQKFFNHFSCSLTFVTALRCVSRFHFSGVYTYIYMLHEYIYMYVRSRWFCFCVSCPTNFA